MAQTAAGMRRIQEVLDVKGRYQCDYADCQRWFKTMRARSGHHSMHAQKGDVRIRGKRHISHVPSHPSSAVDGKLSPEALAGLRHMMEAAQPEFQYLVGPTEAKLVEVITRIPLNRFGNITAGEVIMLRTRAQRFKGLKVKV